MKPRLALVARKVPPLYGGGGMLARSLALGFSERGYQVDLITDTPNPDPVNTCSVLSPYDAQQSSAPIKRLWRRWTEYQWLKRTIENGNYDIVYGVSAQAFILSAVHAAKSLGIPAAFETCLFGSDDFLTVSRQRLGFILRRFFLSADKIVNISPVLEQACITGGIKKHRLAMIPNPVNEEAFHSIDLEERRLLRDNFSISENTRILFSAGAIGHRKGYDRLIGAFLKISETHPETLLVLAGPEGDDAKSKQYAENLRRLLEQAGLSNKVRWLGKIDNVHEWMQAADIFIFASRREGFGTVFTEAMAVGLPIVAYGIPGITEYIFDKECGAFIVDNESQFIDSIDNLLNANKLREQSGNNLRNHYIKHFSGDVIFNQYQKLFAEITRSHIEK